MLTALVLLAQLHTATPVEQLHHHVVFRSELPAAPENFNAAAAKVFNVTARRFVFDFSPSPIVINQGDSVTLNIKSTDVEHGFFLESYMTQGVKIVPGQTATVQFIASTAGTFTFFCDVFCGSGHTIMQGRLTVNAQEQRPPSITGFTPASAPVTGGSVVAITGSDFQNNAVVSFGSVPAVSTIVNSPTSITAITPAHATGVVAITVRNPDGQTATAAAKFTFGNAAPRKRRRAVGR